MEVSGFARAVIIPAVIGILVSQTVGLIGFFLPEFQWLSFQATYLVMLVTVYAGFLAAKNGMGRRYSAFAGFACYIIMVGLNTAAFFIVAGFIPTMDMFPLYALLSAALGFVGGLLAEKL